jgi:hypothetical protein
MFPEPDRAPNLACNRPHFQTNPKYTLFDLRQPHFRYDLPGYFPKRDVPEEIVEFTTATGEEFQDIYPQTSSSFILIVQPAKLLRFASKKRLSAFYR